MKVIQGSLLGIKSKAVAIKSGLPLRSGSLQSKRNTV